MNTRRSAARRVEKDIANAKSPPKSTNLLKKAIKLLLKNKFLKMTKLPPILRL